MQVADKALADRVVAGQAVAPVAANRVVVEQVVAVAQVLGYRNQDRIALHREFDYHSWYKKEP